MFTLRHYEDMSLEEIGDLLGLDVGTVKAHMFRAVTKLRVELRDLYEGTHVRDEEASDDRRVSGPALRSRSGDIYGDHLGECEDARSVSGSCGSGGRWRRSRCRSRYEFLAAQRRNIYARMGESPQARMKWVPALAAAASACWSSAYLRRIIRRPQVGEAGSRGRAIVLRCILDGAIDGADGGQAD